MLKLLITLNAMFSLLPIILILAVHPAPRLGTVGTRQQRQRVFLYHRFPPFVIAKKQVSSTTRFLKERRLADVMTELAFASNLIVEESPATKTLSDLIIDVLKLPWSSSCLIGRILLQI